MIKGISSGVTSGYLTVNGNGYAPYVSPNSNNPMTGMIRMNGGNYEVFDGSTWLSFGGYADVSLSQTAISALDWCQRKMIEEAKIEELAKKNILDPTKITTVGGYDKVSISYLENLIQMIRMHIKKKNIKEFLIQQYIVLLKNKFNIKLFSIIKFL